MEALFLVIILASGFMFTSRYPMARFKQLRTKEWIQYLHIFVWGLPFAFSSLIIVNIIYWCLKSFYFSFDKYWVGKLISSDFSVYVFLWSLLSFCSAWVIGYFVSKKKSFSVDATLKCAEENPLKTAMYKASKSGEFVQITLSSRKVYIGLITLVSDFKSPETKFIKICPFLSGFRDNDTLIMYITNNYLENYLPAFKEFKIRDTKTLKEFVKKDPNLMGRILEKLEPFTNVIPIENILSFAYFDPEVYNTTNENEKS